MLGPKPFLPGSYSDLYRYFGDPRRRDFEQRHIVSLVRSLGSFGSALTHIRCHEAIAETLDGVLQRVKGDGLIKTCDGCFVVRDIRGASAPSLHSWGLAIDLNASEFPLGSDRRQPHDLTVAFEEAGFFYGGDFYHRKDPMHYQWSRPHTI